MAATFDGRGEAERQEPTRGAAPRRRSTRAIRQESWAGGGCRGAGASDRGADKAGWPREGDRASVSHVGCR